MVNFIFNYYFPLLTALGLRFTFHSYYYINFISPWRKQGKHTYKQYRKKRITHSITLKTTGTLSIKHTQEKLGVKHMLV